MKLSNNCIVAFDPSYLPKSGKHTPHKGTFYSGCLLKVEMLETMIDKAEQILSIDIRKKSGTNQSKK